MLNTIIKAILVGRKAIEMVGEMPNIKAPTMGGKVLWTTLIERGGLKLQKNVFTGHCRVLGANNERITWGSESEMRRRLVDYDDTETDTRPTHKWQYRLCKVR